MFQLCISKHGSSALWALDDLAGSSVNFRGQSLLCNKGKWSLSLSSSSLHTIRRIWSSTCHSRGSLSLFGKLHSSAFLPEGTVQCREVEASSLQSHPPGCRAGTAEGCEPSHSAWSVASQHLHQAAWPSRSLLPRASCGAMHPAFLSTSPDCATCCTPCEYEAVWFIANSHRLIYLYNYTLQHTYLTM